MTKAEIKKYLAENLNIEVQTTTIGLVKLIEIKLVLEGEVIDEDSFTLGYN